jgi:hypothetical protein
MTEFPGSCSRGFPGVEGPLGERRNDGSMNLPSQGSTGSLTFFPYICMVTREWKTRRLETVNGRRHLPPLQETSLETEEIPLQETEEIPLHETEEIPLHKTEEIPLQETEEIPLKETEEIWPINDATFTVKSPTASTGNTVPVLTRYIY